MLDSEISLCDLEEEEHAQVCEESFVSALNRGCNEKDMA